MHHMANYLKMRLWAIPICCKTAMQNDSLKHSNNAFQGMNPIKEYSLVLNMVVYVLYVTSSNNRDISRRIVNKHFILWKHWLLHNVQHITPYISTFSQFSIYMFPSCQESTIYVTTGLSTIARMVEVVNDWVMCEWESVLPNCHANEYLHIP